MSKFTTTIPTRGPSGNIFSILGAATSLMKQLDVPAKDILDLQERVMNSDSYEIACAIVKEWFPLEGDGE